MTHTAGDFESLLAAAKGIATDVAAKHAADVDACSSLVSVGSTGR